MVQLMLDEVILMSKYKILIFDLDDTLIDNLENVRYAYTKMIESIGEKYSENGFKKWYEIDKKFWKDWQDGLIKLPDYLKNETGKKSEKFLNWLRAQRVLIYFDNKVSLDEAIKLNNLFMNSLTEVVVAIDGAYDVLKYLKEKHYIIIIATNGPKVATKDKLSKINCLSFVNEILSADMFGYMKPKKEYFEAIQKLLNNYKNDDYLIIGDSLKSDIGFAMNCKFDSCWFNRNNEELSEQYEPTMVIKKLLELKKIL